MHNLIEGNAYWVQVDDNTWLALMYNDKFHITEDRNIDIDDEDIKNIIHIPFPDGWTEEVF